MNASRISPRQWLASLPKVLLDLLYPRRCGWCGEVSAGFPCAKCGNTLKGIAFGSRPVALPATGESIGESTTAGERGVGSVYACFYYEPPVCDVILRLKFQDEPDLAPVLGAELALSFASYGLAGRYDMAVPVPVSPHTLRSRGYNQSALLAAALSDACALPLAADVLLKTTETLQQMTLGKKERMKNVQGAYEVACPARVAGKQILLVDDVATTGSTLNECAKTLLAAGAAHVDALCLATAERRPG